MERVALAHVVNDEIRGMADRFDLRSERHEVGWFCGCGCFTLVDATLADYDANAGRIFAPGHPVDESRVAAIAEFEQQLDPSAVLERLDEELRRRLSEDLALRLKRRELARRVERALANES